MTASVTEDVVKPWGRQEMAARLARDIPEGWYVNLGLGLPTLIPDHIPAGREVVFHSENGVLGMGPVPPKDQVDTWLVNATKQNITLVKGASLFHHADSFGMIRGGHLDLCVLGAYEVAENGDIANWATSQNDAVPAVGGAIRAAAHRVALRLSPDGGVRGEASLYKSRGDRCDGARLRSARHGAGGHAGVAASLHRRQAAHGGVGVGMRRAVARAERFHLGNLRDLPPKPT